MGHLRCLPTSCFAPLRLGTPAKTRRHYCEILDIRRTNVSIWYGYSRTAKIRGSVSRWFALKWLQLIQDAEFPKTELTPPSPPLLLAREQIDVEALRKWPPLVDDLLLFARTLGVYLPGIDAVAFGLVQVASSPPISPMFAAKNALLEDGNWFLTVTSGEELPWIEVDFGAEANVTIQSIGLKTKVRCPDAGDVKIPEKLQVMGFRRRWRVLVAELDLQERVVEVRRRILELLKGEISSKGVPQIRERLEVDGKWEVSCRYEKAVCNRVKIVQKEGHPGDEGEFGYRSNVLRVYHVMFVGRFGLKPKSRRAAS